MDEYILKAETAVVGEDTEIQHGAVMSAVMMSEMPDVAAVSPYAIAEALVPAAGSLLDKDDIRKGLMVDASEIFSHVAGFFFVHLSSLRS